MPLLPPFELVATIEVEGVPVPKGRPRFGQGRAYTDKRTEEHETLVGWLLRGKIRKPLEGSIGVVCRFVLPDRRRVDVDNLLKLVLDAANGIAWADDAQVRVLVGVKSFDADRPRTLIQIGRLDVLPTDPAEAVG